MQYGFYGRKDIKTWLNDKSRKRGATKYNAHYMRLLKTVRSEIGRNNAILYFLLVHLGVVDVRSMLRSSRKQKDLVSCVIHDLKEFELSSDYVEIFNKNIEQLYDRVKWVYKIAKENVRLTEYHPYFEKYGYEKLVDLAFLLYDNENTIEETFKDEILAYNEKHVDEIAAYMESIQPEIERRDKHRRKIEESRKAEKEEAKAIRKAALMEEKEMLKNKKAYEQKQRRYEKELNTTLKRVHGKGDIF